jgi:hypothetical protein
LVITAAPKGDREELQPRIPAGSGAEHVIIPPGLEGAIAHTARTDAVILLAHGSGSGRLSPRPGRLPANAGAVVSGNGRPDRPGRRISAGSPRPRS